MRVYWYICLFFTFSLILSITSLISWEKSLFTGIPFACCTGTKIIFWDLREPFIDNLYKPSVSKSRLESLIEPLDVVRNVCAVRNTFDYWLLS